MGISHQMTEKKRKNMSGGHSGEDVPFSMSQMSSMSLGDRAKLAALIEVDGDPALRKHLLGATEAKPESVLRRSREVPGQWNIIWVMDRLTEAMRVLAMTPDAGRPKGFGSAMPTYSYDRFDLNSQQESGELELALRAKLRSRPTATPDEMSRMYQAFQWSVDYLRDMPEVSKAIWQGAQWEVLGSHIPSKCRDIGLTPRAFLRRRVHGVTIITMGLVRDQVQVS
jgi:hypothetical protein